MSQPQSHDTESVAVKKRQDEFLDVIRETFAPWKKSKQYRDHPTSGDHHRGNSHNDGEKIYQSFGLERLPKYLTRAANMDHPVAVYPKPLAHLVTHIKKWEKWELTEDDPVFDDLPQPRRELFEWYLGYDKPEGEQRENAKEKRMKRLRPGGTGVVLHGEQGTTKTTAMHWLVANIMEVNQQENVIWQSTLDDTEWQVFGSWTTLCLPSGVDVEFTANPHSREYRDLGAFEIEPDDVVRQVIRYDDPEDLMQTLANRTPGQFYVVYPDPRFRKCQSITGWPYETIWDVDSSDEATDLGHFWFALMHAIEQSAEYNEWTTLVGDEAHKWLQSGASDDQHKWHKKIKDWATYWGDARKKRLSCILAIHEWTEMHYMVKNKVRWGATMNGEKFPPEAPIDGSNDHDQGLGDTCIWNKQEWNFVGYPDLKRKFSVPADISVSYPGFDSMTDAKS